VSGEDGGRAASSGSHPALAAGVDPSGETAELPAPPDESSAPSVPRPSGAETPVQPGGETAELESDPPEPGAGGFRARLLRGLRRHEGDRAREVDVPLVERLSFSRYELVREIGRGGMGAVLEARDRTLERSVALKVLLRGDLAGPEARERFQFEARAAARLRHPNIVGLYEVGEEAGNDYLVMELVEGESLAKRLEREGGRLDPREAARIAADVADALYYAHSRAILHRDVKPGNIMLDGERVLLSDFGLAKDVDGEWESVTHTGQAVGTPHYMPPEQLKGEKDRVDRRVDVYALGATLYQCLTGRPPFLGQSVGSVLQQVLNDEPTPPRKLVEGLERDLETVVLTCLEKEPRDRYGSAQELADDLRRVLRHEPIAARRPGPGARLSKWARRNRGVAWALGGSLAVALVVIAVGSALFMAQLRAERDRAEVAAEEARQAVEDLVFEVREELEDVPGARVREARKRLLQSALDRLLRLEEVSGASSEDDHLRYTEALRQGAALAREVGDLNKAKALAARALDMNRGLHEQNPDRPRIQHSLAASLNQISELREVEGRFEDALALELEVLDLARVNGWEAERLALVVSRAATAFAKLERWGEAEPLFEEVLELCATSSGEAAHIGAAVHEQLAELYAATGRPAEQLEQLRVNVAIQRELVERDPGSVARRNALAGAVSRLAGVLYDLGEHTEGDALELEGLTLRRALYEADPGSIRQRNGLAASLLGVAGNRYRAGNTAEAAQLAEEAVGLLRGVDPGEYDGRRAYAVGLERLASYRARLGDPEGAVALQAESVEVERGLNARLPTLERGTSLAIGWRKLAERQRDLERWPAARAAAEASLAVLLEHDAAGTNRQQLGSDLAAAHIERGRAAQAQGDYAAAFGSYVYARTFLGRLAAAEPGRVDLRRRIAHAWIEEARLAQDVGDGAYAVRAFEESLARMRELVDSVGSQTERQNLCAALNAYGRLLKDRGDEVSLAKARELLEEAVTIARALYEVDRSDRVGAQNLNSVLNSLGAVARRQLDFAGAAVAYGEALEVMPPDRGGAVPDRQALLMLISLASAAYDEGNLDRALEHFAQAEAICRARLAAEPNVSTPIRDLAVCLVKTSDVLRDAGRAERGAELLEEAAARMRPLAEQAPERFQKDYAFMQQLAEDARCEAALDNGGVGLSDPKRALRVARVALEQKRPVTAAQAFRCVLADEAYVEDLDGYHLYNGACAASLASATAQDPEAQAEWREQALAWLSGDLARRREVLSDLESRPASPDRDARVAQVRAALEQHLHHARVADPDLAPLRALPRFERLFE